MSNDFRLPVTFLIVLDQVLVARDIELTILDSKPDARAVVARRLEEVDLSGVEGQLAAAFVPPDLSDADRARLRERLARDGGRLVLVGQDHGEEIGPAVALPFPFKREDVTQLVASLAAQT